MKLKSIIRLLKIGQWIAQRQQAIKKSFATGEEIFKQELQFINEVILIASGVIHVQGGKSYIVNTDDYEFLTHRLIAYYNEEISLNQINVYLQSLCKKNYPPIGAKEASTQEQSTEIVNKLLDLKHLLQFKRQKWTDLLGDGNHSLHYEKQIIGMAIEELGDKRYFKRKMTVS
ncbi:hypothetical protein [Ammoniphilus sp. 3BR4]|uniref:hypothetical protein n=1 Tax=Ammoniphilus sp. 3BR4 TaxID=3158265 RepID=UPI0034651C57